MTKGQRIKLMRKAHGLTQIELAQRIHTSKQNLYKYENNGYGIAKGRCCDDWYGLGRRYCCCGAPVDEGTMVCQNCADNVEKEYKSRQIKANEEKEVHLWKKQKKRIKSRKWPLLIQKNIW